MVRAMDDIVDLRNRRGKKRFGSCVESAVHRKHRIWKAKAKVISLFGKSLLVREYLTPLKDLVSKEKVRFWAQMKSSKAIFELALCEAKAQS